MAAQYPNRNSRGGRPTGAPRTGTSRPRTASAGRRTSGSAARSNGGARRTGTQARSRRRRTYRRPFYTKLWFWLAACILIILIVLVTKGCDTGTIDAGGTAATDAVPTTQSTLATTDGGTNGQEAGGSVPQASVPVPSTPTVPAVRPGTSESGSTQGDSGSETVTQGGTETEYYQNRHVGAGTQLIGAELPAGTVDISLISGTGSIATSDGSLSYAAFGQGYTESLAGVELKSGVSITVTGNLSMKFSYRSEPVIDRAAPTLTRTVYTLSGDGTKTYTVGVDIEAGTYEVSIVSGYGEVVSSDAASGMGIDAMMGLTDSGGNYAQTVKNVTLNACVTLTVRDCTVKFTRVETIQ